MGISVSFADFEVNPDFDFSRFDIIYVCGGNTFKLLKYAKALKFGDSIESLLNRSGIYIGVSAGPLILSPTIDVTNEISPDPNEFGLSDLTAFGVVPFHMVVHFEEGRKKKTAAFEQKHKVIVERLSNSQVILISDNNKLKRIG